MNKLSAYNSFFGEIIDTINSARYKAYKSLNKFHIGQNFEIGKIIVENQDKNLWGQAIVDTLSKDINKQIDGVKGYSPQNLWRMRQFYLEYKQEPELLEMAMKIPWGQNMLIIQQLKNNLEVEYALRTSNKPIGVSEYKLTHRLPDKFKGKVPTSKELKQMLIKAINNGG